MIEQFKKISLIGRITYGIMCAEEYLTTKYTEKNWGIVFEKYWEITNLRYWDDWIDETIEYIPEYLFEFNNYESSNFEYLSKQKYNELIELYQNVDYDVNVILKAVYDLANSHVYSSIIGYGEESLNALNNIILFLKRNGIKLPSIEKVSKLSFSERNGWGNSFNGIYLSKTINF